MHAIFIPNKGQHAAVYVGYIQYASLEQTDYIKYRIWLIITHHYDLLYLG